MVQACLPAVPLIKTVTDGLGSVRKEMISFMEKWNSLLVISFNLPALGFWQVLQPPENEG